MITLVFKDKNGELVHVGGKKDVCEAFKYVKENKLDCLMFNDQRVSAGTRERLNLLGEPAGNYPQTIF